VGFVEFVRAIVSLSVLLLFVAARPISFLVVISETVFIAAGSPGEAALSKYVTSVMNIHLLDIQCQLVLL
jgi:hypothetical protein